MEKKKSRSADLERKKPVFLQTGFIAAISFALAAFTWTSYEIGEFNKDYDTGLNIIVLEDDFVPHHVLEKPKPKKTSNVVLDVIDIVDDDYYDELEDDKKEDELLIEIDFSLDDYGDSDEVPDIILRNTDNSPKGFMAVEKKPYFKDCENVLNPIEQMQCTNIGIKRWINRNAKYPSRARDLGVQGIVTVSFVISKTGDVKDVKVEESVHPDLDKEAIRAVMTLPQFVPGSQQGRKVDVAYKIPVKFLIH